MQKFTTIYNRAAKRKGGVDALDALLNEHSYSTDLTQIPDDRYLAEMTKRVFSAGFVWNKYYDEITTKDNPILSPTAPLSTDCL